jgi:heparinase II/III-like protein
MGKAQQLALLFEHSPAYAAKRISGALSRRVRKKYQYMRDQLATTYHDDHDLILTPLLYLDIDSSSPEHNHIDNYKMHRFDLLGSGLIDVKREGVAQVNKANASHSRYISSYIGSPGYQFIDWQLDFKSGYRWSEKDHFTVIPYGHKDGVDIKVPWELSRLQHLPQMALWALMHKDPAIVHEIKSQILDFLAHNPPRFGVNWRCPMDVGIRTVNLVMTHSLLSSAGFELDKAFQVILGNAVQDHVDHILANLEWSETARGNHYLANILGLLFGAAALDRSPRNIAMLAFAIQEFFIEVKRQFLSDGASFEGSTGYHRLSSEMLYWGTALILGLPEELVEQLASYDAKAIKTRPPFSQRLFKIEEGKIKIPSYLHDAISQSRKFIEDTTKPDGLSLKIGDYDSGRLLKLFVPLKETREVILDHSPALSLANGLFENQVKDDGLVLSALRKERRLEPALSRITRILQQETSFESFDQVQTVIAIEGLDSLRLSCYREFGLYIWKTDDFMMTLRCHEGQGLREWGHFHDDNLGLTLYGRGQDLIADPGSYLYSAKPEDRRAYQASSAHYVPRLENCPAMAFGPSLFEAKPLAKGDCLKFDQTGSVMTLTGQDWSLARRIKITSKTIEITDMSLTAGKKLVRHSYNPQLKDTLGYGKKSERPIYSV